MSMGRKIQQSRRSAVEDGVEGLAVQRCYLLPFCMASVSQLCTSCFRTLKAGPAAGSTPMPPEPSISASASQRSMEATARLYSRSCTQTHLCAPDAVICMQGPSCSAQGACLLISHVSTAFLPWWSSVNAKKQLKDTAAAATLNRALLKRRMQDTCYHMSRLVSPLSS